MVGKSHIKVLLLNGLNFLYKLQFLKSEEDHVKNKTKVIDTMSFRLMQVHLMQVRLIKFA